MLDLLLPPRKVLALAMTMGVHADCVAADAELACPDCLTLMTLATDHFYGHIPTLGEVFDEMFEDMKKDYL